MAHASPRPPSPSPDPNRRRCRQCQQVGVDRVAVGQRKFKTNLWSWYCGEHIPANDASLIVWIDDGRVDPRGPVTWVAPDHLDT